MMRIIRFAVSLATLLSIAPVFAESTPDASDPSLQFSSPDIDTTPSGQAFHGPFLDETLNISTNLSDKLPPHEFLDISFDLLILRSWDGSVETLPGPEAHIAMPLGPDYFRLGLLKGPTLLYTTFSNRPDNPGFRDDAKWQMYPSQVPGTHLDAQTGADAKNTMGYGYPWPNARNSFPWTPLTTSISSFPTPSRRQQSKPALTTSPTPSTKVGELPTCRLNRSQTPAKEPTLRPSPMPSPTPLIPPPPTSPPPSRPSSSGATTLPIGFSPTSRRTC